MITQTIVAGVIGSMVAVSSTQMMVGQLKSAARGALREDVRRAFVLTENRMNRGDYPDTIGDNCTVDDYGSYDPIEMGRVVTITCQKGESGAISLTDSALIPCAPCAGTEPPEEGGTA